MSLTTEYRGYHIGYSENDDTWGCYDAGVHGQKTLGGVKKKIDDLHLKMRKAASVACFEVRGNEGKDGWYVSLTEATAIEYLGPHIERRWMSSAPPEITGHKIATVAKRGGSQRGARRETMMASICPHTSEVHEAVVAANALGAEAFAAAERFRAAVRDIPRLQLADIKDLMAASEARLEE